jgi:hypothetical protein
MPGKKFTITNEHPNEIRDTPLTDEDVRKWSDEINAKMAVLKQEWETSEDATVRVHALLAGLIFCEAHLPRWVFKGLFDSLIAKLPQEPALHCGRWLLVKEALDQGLSYRGAYVYAAERLAGSKYEGKPRTMKESYQICQRELRQARARTH